MIDSDLIVRKLKNVSEYTAEAEQIFQESFDEQILEDSLKYHTLERLFQLIVDAMIDINIHLIRVKEGLPPDDLESTFVVLGKIGVLPGDFSMKIAPVVGLRNRVVHRYESLSRTQFVSEFRKNLSDFKKYSVYIAELIK